jgi:SpoVK/Ycf46/Vps4 family AAA+-type ATPase
VTQHEACRLELDLQIRSNRALIYIVTHEERRVLSALGDLCCQSGRGWNVVSWDADLGIQVETGNLELSRDDRDRTQVHDGVLPWFRKFPRDPTGKFTVLVMKDFHKFIGSGDRSSLTEKIVCRQLRNLAQSLSGTNKAIIMVGPALSIPEEMSKECAVIDWPLPERVDIEQEVKALLSVAREAYQSEVDLDHTDAEMDEIVSAFLGLTIDEIRLLVPYSLQKCRRLDASTVADKKREIIRKSGVLEWIDTDVTLDQVGGYDDLKSWIRKRKKAFGAAAREFGVDMPKGIFILGVQGCGKSTIAKAASHELRVPMLKLDFGQLYASLLGQSEANVRMAIKTAESVAPCVLFADEIEKGISTSRGGGDGGTSSRILGTMLTWMAEKTSPVFIMATANDVSHLPPEVIRMGRFDDVFFVDLPDAAEREHILRIHVAKRRRDAEGFDLARVASLTADFSGAELESIVSAALLDAFDVGRELSTEDLVNAAKRSVPLARTRREVIMATREWMVGRARRASDGGITDAPEDEKDRTVRNISCKLNPEEDEEL